MFVASNGVVLVDTKYRQNWGALLAQVRMVTDKPITYVINTHVHPDHTGGNVFLPESVEVIVQANTAANIVRLRAILDPSNARRRPMRTYSERMTLFSGDDAIDLYYFGPAHTNGDTFVVFRAAGVMHAGDVFPDKEAPIISFDVGGDGALYADALDKAIGGIRGVQRVITGHGPVYPWNDFVEFGEFYRLLLENARTAIKSGKDRNRAMQELTLPAKFNAYRLDRADMIYISISRPWYRRMLSRLRTWLSGMLDNVL